MFIRFVVPAIGVLIFVNSIIAEDNCQNPQTSYDRTYCAAKLFLESDKELNSVYKELKGMLKQEEQKQLVLIQREWIKYRDSKCENQGTIDVDCNHQVNVARIEYLRERLRECKAGQPRADLIAKASW